MAWYRAETTRRTHRKIRRLAEILSLHRLHAVGIHDTLCAMVTEAGRVNGSLAGISAKDIAADADFDGNPDDLFAALVETKLIDAQKNGKFRVHDFKKFAGTSKETARMARYRAKLATSESQLRHSDRTTTYGRTDVRTNERTDRAQARSRPPSSKDQKQKRTEAAAAKWLAESEGKNAG